MINRLVRRPILAAAVIALGLAAGCAGGASEDDRTAGAAESSSSKPAINDPAVEAAALRTVDPCGLLSEENLAEVGTIVPDSLHEVDWAECAVEVNSSSGGVVELTLRVGDNVVIVDDPTEKVDGLPLIVDKSDEETCYVTAVTSFEAELGINFQVNHAGGDACAAGRSALEKVVGTLHSDPPQYKQPPGSVLTVDPCEIVDQQVLGELLGGAAERDVMDLHTCYLSPEGESYPVIGVRLTGSVPADSGDPLELPGGVTAIQEQETGSSDVSCRTSWRHIKTPREDQSDAFGEIVSITYNVEAGGGVDPAGACEKSATIAKAVVTKLPAA